MSGHLIVITGPMFAGKSTEMVLRLKWAYQNGKRVQAIRPKRDIRHLNARVITHDGLSWPATRVSHALDIEKMLYSGVSVVGIDEANMFGHELIHVCLRLIEKNIDVIVSGLNLNYLGQPFEPIPSLLCYADETINLKARCSVCGGEALFSQRLIESDDLILPGGKEAYEPRCLRCFNPLNGKIKEKDKLFLEENAMYT